MVDINPTISIVTYNMNGIYQLKGSDYQSRSREKKTQLCVAYKEPTLNIKTQIG